MNSDEQRKPLRLPPLPSQAPPHLGPSNNTSPSVSSTGCAQRCVPADAAADVWQLFHQVGSDSRGKSSVAAAKGGSTESRPDCSRQKRRGLSISSISTHADAQTRMRIHTHTHLYAQHARTCTRTRTTSENRKHTYTRTFAHVHAYTYTCTGTGWAKCPPGLVQGKVKIFIYRVRGYPGLHLIFLKFGHRGEYNKVR